MSQSGTEHRVNTLRRQTDIQLKASEQRFRMVWEAAGDAMILVDLKGFILAANPAFLDLFGLTRETVIDKHFTDFVPEPDLEMAEKEFQSLLPNGPVVHFERQLSRQDGTPIVVDARINSLKIDGQQPILLAIVRDITEPKRGETAFQKARDQLAASQADSQNLVSTLDLSPLLNLILDQLAAVIRYDAAAVLGIHYKRVEPLLYRGPTIPDDLAYLRFHIVDNPILQQISRSKEDIYIEDAHAWEALEQRFGGNLGEWRNGLALHRSWLAIPLIVKGDLIGALVLAHTQPDRFDPAARSRARAFADQAAIAFENAWLYRQAQEAAVATERARLARDLHDVVIQALYAINLHSEASRLALLAGEVDVAIQNLDDLQAMVQEAVNDLRMLIYELRPPVLEEIGLAAALKNRLESVEARAGIHADLQVEGDGVLPQGVETELFWVTQEALTNVLKHAQATHVQVHLRFEESLIRLAIRDNGIGFNPHDVDGGKGMGLHNLSERVQRIGGTMKVETSPGAGTGLIIELRNIDIHRAGHGGIE